MKIYLLLIMVSLAWFVCGYLIGYDQGYIKGLQEKLSGYLFKS